MKAGFRLVSLLVSGAAVMATAGPGTGFFCERNTGQLAAEFDAVCRTPEAAVYLNGNSALFRANAAAPVRMRLTGASAEAPEFEGLLPGVSNYLQGNDPEKWRTGIRHFGRVRYRNIYRGIDLVYYGNDRSIEYDFIVSPGADHRDIELAFEGADTVRRSAGDHLLVETAGATIQHMRPRVLQTGPAGSREIPGGYRVDGVGRVRFALASYDRTRPLVIDPVIQFATYLGRSGQDSGVGIAADAAGNVYVGGETTSNEFGTRGTAQDTRAGDQDAFLAKLSPQGELLFVTYLGGSKTDTGLSVAVDSEGNPYLSGVTFSPNFPTRSAAFSEFGGEYDSFVAKLNATGSQLVYSTLLGGRREDWATHMTVDSRGGAWVTGWTTSTDFPVQGAIQGATAGGCSDAFVTRIAPTGQAITYSTYFGGDGRDYGSGIAVDASGHVYVTGATTSTLLMFANPIQRRAGGNQDAFVFKLNPETNGLDFSTFLGGSGEDAGTRVAFDASGSAYIAGYTKSSDFPVSRGVFQTANAGGGDLFAAKISAGGGLEFSTYLGGTANDWAGGIGVDAAGAVYVGGWTSSPNFPTRNAIQASHRGGSGSTEQHDAVIVRLAPDGGSLLYSTFYGGTGEDRAYGLAVDGSGNVYVAGSTTSTDLPSTAGEFSRSAQGTADAFVLRLSADTSVNLIAARPGSLAFEMATGDVPATQTVEVTSFAGTLSFTTASSEPWLTVVQSSGSAPARLVVSVSNSSLAPGVHAAEITLRSASNTVRIPVTLTLALRPAITAVSPSPLPRAQNDVPVTISGGGYTETTAVEIQGSRVNSTFVDSRTLRAIVPSVLASQLGTLSITVVNAGVRSAVFPLQVVADRPIIAAAGILHGATRAAGPVAPGEIVIVSGTGFGGDRIVAGSAAGGLVGTELSGVRVLFDGVAAPLLWTAPGQTSAVVPYGVAARSSVQVEVEYRNQRSAPVTVPVSAASPGLFTADTSGTGLAVAFNQDGSMNAPSNPADRDSILVLYATGEGLLSPQPATGSLALEDLPLHPVLPVRVLIGGASADVIYAGSSPGQVAGLLQLNVRVPKNIAAGTSLPVSVEAGPYSSPRSGVFVAVR